MVLGSSLTLSAGRSSHASMRSRVKRLTAVIMSELRKPQLSCHAPGFHTSQPCVTDHRRARAMRLIGTASRPNPIKPLITRSGLKAIASRNARSA